MATKRNRDKEWDGAVMKLGIGKEPVSVKIMFWSSDAEKLAEKAFGPTFRGIKNYFSIACINVETPRLPALDQCMYDLNQDILMLELSRKLLFSPKEDL